MLILNMGLGKTCNILMLSYNDNVCFTVVKLWQISCTYNLSKEHITTTIR